MIERLKVVNFRSFRELEVELRPLNVLVGANASGKSNLVQVFRFLRDLARHDLENAIALQGGVGRIGNIKSDSPITEIGIELVPKKVALVSDSKEKKVTQISYSVRIGYNRRKIASILSETLKILLVNNHDTSSEWIQVVRERDRVFLPPEFAGWLWRGNKQGKAIIPETISLLRTPFAPFPWFDKSIAIYDFQPKLAKQAVPVAGSADLEEDGRNLPLVLQRLLRNPESRKRLLLLTQYFTPFIKSMNVQNLPNSSVMLSVQETYLGKHQLPASLLSDGTVEVIALIVACYFSSPFAETLIFEEPDRNLHPGLMEGLINIFREASTDHQLIITTHNPELVNCTNLEELLLIERDQDGFSIIKRPCEQVMVQAFLEEQLSLGTLHTQQLLGD